MNEAPRFTIGDTVFVPLADAYHGEKRPCPICFGKCQVTLILGNGEQQPVECDFCGKGYQGPQGEVTVYGVRSEVLVGVVTGVRQDDFSGKGWRVQVRGREYHQGEVYSDADSAELRRAAMHQEAAELAQRNFESQFKHGKKQTTWTAGYHRKEIANLEQKMEWHRKKLGALKEKP